MGDEKGKSFFLASSSGGGGSGGARINSLLDRLKTKREAAARGDREERPARAARRPEPADDAPDAFPAPTSSPAAHTEIYLLERLPTDKGLGLGLSATLEISDVVPGENAAKRAAVPKKCRVIAIDGEPVRDKAQFGEKVKGKSRMQLTLTASAGGPDPMPQALAMQQAKLAAVMDARHAAEQQQQQQPPQQFAFPPPLGPPGLGPPAGVADPAAAAAAQAPAQGGQPWEQEQPWDAWGKGKGMWKGKGFKGDFKGKGFKGDFKGKGFEKGGKGQEEGMGSPQRAPAPEPEEEPPALAPPALGDPAPIIIEPGQQAPDAAAQGGGKGDGDGDAPGGKGGQRAAFLAAMQRGKGLRAAAPPPPPPGVDPPADFPAPISAPGADDAAPAAAEGAPSPGPGEEGGPPAEPPPEAALGGEPIWSGMGKGFDGKGKGKFFKGKGKGKFGGMMIPGPPPGPPPHGAFGKGKGGKPGPPPGPPPPLDPRSGVQPGMPGGGHMGGKGGGEVPSEEELNVMEKLVASIASNDCPDVLEQKLLEKQAHNPIFAFLRPDHKFHKYYKWRLRQMQEAHKAIESAFADIEDALDDGGAPAAAGAAAAAAPEATVGGMSVSSAPQLRLVLNRGGGQLRGRPLSSAAPLGLPAKSAAPPGDMGWREREQLEKDAARAIDGGEPSTAYQNLQQQIRGGPPGVVQGGPAQAVSTEGLTPAQQDSMRRNVSRTSVLHQLFADGQMASGAQTAAILSGFSTKTDVGMQVRMRGLGVQVDSSSSSSDSSSSDDSSKERKRKRKLKKKQKKAAAKRGAAGASGELVMANQAAPQVETLPPETYQCPACKKRGHWYTHCPQARPGVSASAPAKSSLPQHVQDAINQVRKQKGLPSGPAFFEMKQQQLRKQQEEDAEVLDPAPPPKHAPKKGTEQKKGTEDKPGRRRRREEAEAAAAAAAAAEAPPAKVRVKRRRRREIDPEEAFEEEGLV